MKYSVNEGLPLPFSLDGPSTPSDLRLGTEGVEEGVGMSTLLPPGVWFPPVLEFRRELLPSVTDWSYDWMECEFEDPCLSGDSETPEWLEDPGKVLDPTLCTRCERPEIR